jgi:transcriptional regulator with XRE-family HTH domain
MQTNLAELRTQRKLSQIDLADLLGVTKLTVGRWERGEMMPRQYFRERLSQIFDAQGLFFTRVEDESALVEPVPSSPLYDPAIPLSPVISLVGREQDLARIKAQLQSNEMITALHGLPGVGKTSLAIQLVHDPEIRASFCDGILWAGLGPTPDICSLLNRWGAGLRLGDAFLSSRDIQEKCQALREALGTRSMLLVLDDTWRLEDVYVLLCVGGPNCRVLLTTRFPTIATVDGNAYPFTISELDEEQSLTLLRNLAPEAVSHYETEVRELVRGVGGLPLALTLLGKHLHKESYHAPARRIGAAIERLSRVDERFKISQRSHASAHPSLPDGAVISLPSIVEVTDRLLSPLAREALYALSVLPRKPESFSENAALTVASCTIHELDELLDAGLLEVQGEDRYRLHPIISDYAGLHLDSQTEWIVRQRLLVYGMRLQEYEVEEALQTGSLGRSTRCIRLHPAHLINSPTRETLFSLSIESRESSLRGRLEKSVPPHLGWQTKRLLTLLRVSLDRSVLGRHGELYSALVAFVSAWDRAQEVGGLPKKEPSRWKQMIGHPASLPNKDNSRRRPSAFWAETNPFYKRPLSRPFLGRANVWRARLLTAERSSINYSDRPP